MSDISASDAGAAVSEAPAGDVTEVEFDLDAAVEDFATNAPEEWKSKASKIQSELKGLRGSRNELREKFGAFEGLHEDDFKAVNTLVSALKDGNTDAAAEWLFNAAKGLTGDEFEAKFGLTKAEAAEAVADAQEAAGEPEPELTVAEQIEKALADRDKAHQESLAAAERQAAINSTFAELGYSTERNEQGHLVDVKARIVAQMAIDAGKGDIKAAHEAFEAMQADWAKAYLQKHTDDQTLSPDGGTAVTNPDPGSENMTPAQRAQARINRSAGGAQA